MGTLYQFRCESCGYETEVSGGRDCGMASATVTILCETCYELFDVVTSADAVLARPEREVPIGCPNDSAHSCQLWTSPGPCPKCGAPMVRGEETLIWD
jgi:hypothetical protein